jgi:hypothetical protein
MTKFRLSVTVYQKMITAKGIHVNPATTTVLLPDNQRQTGNTPGIDLAPKMAYTNFERPSRNAIYKGREVSPCLR